MNNITGNQYRTPTKSDMSDIGDYIISIIKNVDEYGDVSIIQDSIANNKIAFRNDEGRVVTEEVNISDRQILDEELAKGEQIKPQQYLNQAYKECQLANDNLRGTYYTKPEDMRPVSEKDIKSVFSSENIEQAKRNVANSEFIDWYNDDISYKNCSYKVNNTVKQFKLAKVKVNWGTEFKEGLEYIPHNMEVLKKLVVKGIYEIYGSWDRITEIAVVDNMLIMNGVCYFPSIEEKYLSRFPLDSFEYIKNGCIAPFFDWNYLRKMRKLSVLSVDNESFYATKVADDLGLCRNIGVSSVFNICPSLMTLILGGRVLNRDALNSDKSVTMKKSLAKTKRGLIVSDSYKINVYNCTNGLQDYMFGNLKNYATNRGNKGLFRFCVGTAVRLGLAGASGILNAGVHLLGGMYNVIKEVCAES